MRVIKNIARWRLDLRAGALWRCAHEGHRVCYGLSFILYPFLFIISLISFSACSSDSELEPAVAEPTGVPVELQGYVAGYEDARKAATRADSETYGVTRAWEVPSGFASSAWFDDKFISVFFAREPKAPETVESESYKLDMEEEFFYKSSGNWRVSKTNLTENSSNGINTYYLYGYVPHEQYVSPSIKHKDGSSNYADGAVLTLDSLNAISTNDYCVIVGAKNGNSADNDNGLTRGQFTYTAGEHNYFFLLFYHLYAAMNVNIKVNGAYAALRTIKLKDLELKTGSYDATPDTIALTKKKTMATITLTKTTEGADPISDVTFAASAGYTSNNADVAICSLFHSEKGEELGTGNLTDMPYTCYFMAQDITHFILTSTYDVYDKKGNLIRQNCTAENNIVLADLITAQTYALRGRRYTINMTVNPTYLYMLSEPDLDSPTMVVN